MVIPSDIEKYLGEVWDPRDGLEKIEKANAAIHSFVSDMSANQVPRESVEKMIEATDVLGLYAGYPSEAADMESYIKSDEALSYRDLAIVLERFCKNMNTLIHQRVQFDRGAKSVESKINDSDAVTSPNEVPF